MKVTHIVAVGLCIFMVGCTTTRSDVVSVKPHISSGQKEEFKRGMDFGIIVAGEKTCGYKYDQIKLNAVLGKEFKNIYGPFRAGFTAGKSFTLTYYQGNTQANQRDVCKDIHQRARKYGLLRN